MAAGSNNLIWDSFEAYKAVSIEGGLHDCIFELAIIWFPSKFDK